MNMKTKFLYRFICIAGGARILKTGVLFVFVIGITGCYLGPPVPWVWNAISKGQKENIVFDINNSDAKVLWETRSTPALYYSETSQLFVGGDPIISKSGILYVQGSEHTLKAINPQTGELITTYTVADPFVISGYYNDKDEIIFAVINKGENTFTKVKRSLVYFVVINEKDQKLVAFTYGNAFATYALSEYIYTYYTNDIIIDLWQGFNELEARDIKNNLIWSNKPGSRWLRKPGNTLAAYTYNDIVYGLIDPHDNKHLIVKAYKVSDGKTIWETSFKKIEDIKYYSIQQYKNTFLFIEGKTITKGKDNLPVLGGKIVALHLSDGTMVWQRNGYVANYPHIKNTIYIVAPHTSNMLQVVSPETGAVITGASLEDAAPLIVVFEAPHGFMCFSKDQKHLNYRNKEHLNVMWSLKISNVWSAILPDINNYILTFDAPYSPAYEYGKMAYTENRYRFTDTTFAADATTGKILWKARIEGDNPIVVRTVLARNNMAFIKTAAGNVFAVKWTTKR